MNAAIHFIRIPSTLLCATLLFMSSCLQASDTAHAIQQHENYAGSQSCRTCHTNIYNQYIKTGHPYKIQAVTGPVTFPTGTSPGVPYAPKDKHWDDISYIIGGFAWKARFIDNEGYILTGKNQRQYNLENPILGLKAGWSGYSANTAPRKPYTCGSCHTTAWVATGKDGPHQDNLPGMYGVWAEPGVTCEACHGPGALHVKAPKKNPLTTEENCGSCHRRGDVKQIDAKGGLIRHHEQYEDLLASPHEYLKCGACHSPHLSVKYPTGGFKGEANTCLTCHTQRISHIPAKAKFECITCHMPRMAKSAVSIKHDVKNGEVPEGDIRSHIFRISLDPLWKMFSDDGKFVRLDEEGKAFIPAANACLTCHTNKDKQWAIESAKSMHHDTP